MASVARSSPGTTHHNTLALHKVKLFFQLYAGSQGTNADRAIADVDYTLRVGGRVCAKGKTAADGSVTVYIMPCAGGAELEILGSKYDLKLARLWEPTETLGEQRRLQLMGYFNADIQLAVTTPMGIAGLNFQADHPPRDPDGNFDSDMDDKLKADFGE